MVRGVTASARRIHESGFRCLAALWPRALARSHLFESYRRFFQRGAGADGRRDAIGVGVFGVQGESGSSELYTKR
jgi:hypothetical protein